MQFIMFTKHLLGLSLTELIKSLVYVGVSGADLAVRKNYPINPDNMEKALPSAAKSFKDAGLEIPIVTAPTSLTKPTSDSAETFYAACGAASIPHIKLGYWHWSPDQPFWDCVFKIREWLNTFEQWSIRYNVKTLIHNHSGNSLGMNSSQIMHLISECNPAHVGVFADPGHLSVCGEPIEMALSIVEKYLSCIAFKDRIRISLPESQGGYRKRGAPNKTYTVPLGLGFVDCEATISTLQKMEFRGPVSIHSEYDESIEDVLSLTKLDLNYINQLLNK